MPANVVANTKFDTPINNFSVAKNPETGSLQSYFLTAGSLWHVDGDKEKACLGKVEGNGRLIPSDNAQAGWRVCWCETHYVQGTWTMVRFWC